MWGPGENQPLQKAILRADCGHPRHILKGIPGGQLLKICFICSDKVDHTHKSEQTNYQCGYSVTDLNRALDIAGATSRDDLLREKIKGLVVVVHQYFQQITAFDFTRWGRI